MREGSVGIAVHHHKLLHLVLGSHGNHQSPSRRQLMQQRLGQLRRGGADVNDVIGTAVWVPKMRLGK